MIRVPFYSPDRSKPGSKRHVLADANGVPLSMVSTGANVHDVKGLIPLVDEVPSVNGLVGHPRKRPDALQADTAYDSKAHRAELRKRGIRPLIPNRGREHGSGLGKTRWVIERTLAWLHRFRKLQIRWKRRPDIHKAFMLLGGALICLNCANWQLC
ncbi:MAG: IS5 family transposase [Planctomycetota bacterium]|nr:MAG: IS5 family transposase [Planctomycetota bacterium]